MKFCLLFLLLCAVLVCILAASNKDKHHNKNHKRSSSSSSHHTPSSRPHSPTHRPHLPHHRPSSRPHSPHHRPTSRPHSPDHRRHSPSRRPSITGVPRPDQHPRQPNGFFVSHLDTGAARDLHPSENSHFEHAHAQSVDATLVPLSAVLNAQALRRVIVITDLVDPSKDKSLSDRTKEILRRLDGGGTLHFNALQIRDKGRNFCTLKIIEGGHHDPPTTSAYWLPQKGHIDIPLHPGEHYPKLVLTVGFSGCSIAADLKDDHTIRVYHVNGGSEEREYNRKNHFLGMIGILEYKNYAYHMQGSHRIEHRTATAFLEYVGSIWVIKYQMIENIPNIKKVISMHNKNAKLEVLFPNSARVVGYAEEKLRVPAHRLHKPRH